jgi:hypothetical protein
VAARCATAGVVTSRAMVSVARAGSDESRISPKPGEDDRQGDHPPSRGQRAQQSGERALGLVCRLDPPRCVISVVLALSRRKCGGHALSGC